MTCGLRAVGQAMFRDDDIDDDEPRLNDLLDRVQRDIKLADDDVAQTNIGANHRCRDDDVGRDVVGDVRLSVCASAACHRRRGPHRRRDGADDSLLVARRALCAMVTWRVGDSTSTTLTRRCLLRSALHARVVAWLATLAPHATASTATMPPPPPPSSSVTFADYAARLVAAAIALG